MTGPFVNNTDKNSSIFNKVLGYIYAHTQLFANVSLRFLQDRTKEQEENYNTLKSCSKTAA